MKNENRRFKHWLYDGYLILLLVLIIASIGFRLFGVIDTSALLVILGGIASFFYFVQKQQLEELKLFNELYRDFNARYDKMNEELNRIVSANPTAPLTAQETYQLYDYFNLCSEEYLFYLRGYIFPEVWEAWCNGIWFYLKNTRVSELWDNEEKNAASYYGLTLAKIKLNVKNSS